ncbi:hypothetical protein RHGRI_004481 [Rhododendron griersonianum]|uniref:Uncharacterized protein n=1 Tax=Rhododendron griersonianum TaxID=479676 RepID=A0AAV6L9U0_9ERIC|nr:hypothetical protein RHGRI_004481 [Rhododendron griersonianum]
MLGFFSPGNSVSRYVGIWYNETQIQSVVWVANRESPISSESGILTVGNAGNLMVLDGYGNQIWYTNSPAVPGNSTSTAILMDTGNLILSSSKSVGDQGKAIWQSFDDPTDTFLPDMKVYIDVQSDEDRVFTSWKSENDPSIGKYSMGIDPRGSPQIVIWDGLNRHWRSGHWNGIIFTGIPTMRTLYSYGFKLIKESGTFYFTYTLPNASVLMRFRIHPDGIEEQLRWDEGTSKWSIVQLQPSNDCEVYNRCGAYGMCNVMEKPICSCLKGFVPKYESEWEGENWSGGCVRRTNLGCGNTSSEIGVAEGEPVDGFLKIEGAKLPDFASLVMVEKIDECRQNCLKNCSCHAYAFVSGINCMVWSGDLVDMQRFVDGGNDLYIRIARSELGNKRKISKLLIILLAVIGIFFISVSIWILLRARARASGPMRLSGGLSLRRSVCRGIGRTSSKRGSSSSTRGRRWMPHPEAAAAATSVIVSDAEPDFFDSCFSTEALETDILGHGNQGWHLYSEESGHGFTRSRSNEKIIDDESFRPSDTHADGKYSRSGRENRGSFSQKDWKCHSRENGGSPNGPGRPLDVSDQRSVDGTITVNSHLHSDFVNTWDHYKSGGVNGLSTGQRFESENSLGSIDWKPLKWARSESMCSRGSGLSNSSSSKSMGVDSSEARAEAQMGNVTPVQSPSGDVVAFDTSAVAPSEETSAKKKPRLGWGEALAKYEKQKVDGPDDIAANNEAFYCGRTEPLQLQV